MGSSDIDKSPKEAKEAKTPYSQEQASSIATCTVNPDWSGFQGYSPMPPHGFMASSPQAHPYMWGVQHLMPPYGTPPHPYVAMYPHGGIYAHPSIPPGSYPFSPFVMPSPNGIAEAAVNTHGNAEVDGKSSEGKEKLPIKRSKGSLGSLNMITGKNSEHGKISGASANGVYSKSAGSGSEGSSEGSDANSQNESPMKSAGRQDSAEASQNGNSAHSSPNGGTSAPHSSINQTMAIMPMSAAGAGGVPGPTTNLNIGMDYWNAAASPSIPAIHGKALSASVAGGMVTAGSRDIVQSQMWTQDERELKRQRRKQSNRESARRSRLRKQAECDELAQRAEVLKEENASLRAELSRLRNDHDQLAAQNASLKSSPFSVPRLGIGPGKAQTRNWTIRTATSGSSGGDLVPVAPVQLESAVGQLLAQMLQTHPHLLPAAIEQQLENLQNERDTQLKENQPSSKDVLHKRIAEVKEKERRKVLEEILYCLIVHKFVDNDISMIPKISETSDPTGSVGSWPNQEQKLESVHSPDAFEMIISHISIVLGERAVGPLDSIVPLSKIKLGKLYAASIMYGYFLKRVDERYQLERTMSKPPESFQISTNPDEPAAPRQLWDPDSLIEIYPEDGDREGFADSDTESKPERLRSYVMYLDAETLQRYATLRSTEAVTVIEKQTQALFGRPDIKVSGDGTLDVSNDEVLSVTYSGLTMLVLEAVAFGSFLWEAESYVESKYHIINS